LLPRTEAGAWSRLAAVAAGRRLGPAVEERTLADRAGPACPAVLAVFFARESPVSPVSADASAVMPPSAPPMPRATARAPTRPTNTAEFGLCVSRSTLVSSFDTFMPINLSC
jgi:hypothetical protein